MKRLGTFFDLPTTQKKVKLNYTCEKPVVPSKNIDQFVSAVKGGDLNRLLYLEESQYVNIDDYQNLFVEAIYSGQMEIVKHFLHDVGMEILENRMLEASLMTLNHELTDYLYFEAKLQPTGNFYSICDNLERVGYNMDKYYR